MRFERSSGILLHPTSLPGKQGIGDLGESSYRFVDFLAEAGQSLWQVLPLGPTGFGDSPYQLLSVFAGNPLLISIDKLIDDGLLPPSYLDNISPFTNDYVDYERVIDFKTHALNEAYKNFSITDDYVSFCEEASLWLNDYSLYRSLKEYHSGAEWTRWDKYLKARDKGALHYWRQLHADEINKQKFQQYIFFKQWKDLVSYAHKKGIQLIGDIPIFAAHDSADVWSQRNLFYLFENDQPALVAGVPPDYFSETGQLWGNPLYRWDLMKQDGYKWWIDRIKWALKITDIVRLDHFRGFDMYWAVPSHEETAINGRWERGPGEDLFNAIHEALGSSAIIAEDLGFITPEVDRLRESFGFPGMCVLQFSLTPLRPISPNTVVYTGTHDNDTILGWFYDERNNDAREKILQTIQSDGNEINWDLIRYAMNSDAHTVIVPLQDVLGLGSEARMNKPARQQDNWSWRFKEEQLTSQILEHLKEITILTNRHKLSF